MLEPYKNAVLYSEIIAAVFATVFYFKYKNTSFKYVLFVLWFIVFIETLGRFHEELHLYYTDENGVKYNWWLHNVLYIVVYPIFYYMYYKILQTKKYRLIIKIFFIVFALTSIINWSFFESFYNGSRTYPIIIGSACLTICVIFYFIELLKSEKIIRFHRSVPFWISIGLLIYYTSTIPFSVVRNSYALADAALKKMFLINYILAIAMYLIITFGFIWSKKE